MCRIVQGHTLFAGRVKGYGEAAFFGRGKSLPRYAEEQPLFARPRNEIPAKTGIQPLDWQKAKLIQQLSHRAGEAKLRVIPVQAAKTLLLDRDQIVDLADRARISIVTR